MLDYSELSKHLKETRQFNMSPKKGKVEIRDLKRNKKRCAFYNRDDLANLSFILKVSVFAEVHVEPSRTFMMKLFAKIA